MHQRVYVIHLRRLRRRHVRFATHPLPIHWVCMEELSNRFCGPSPISWSAFDLVLRSGGVTSWVKAARNVLVDLWDNYWRGVSGLVDTVLTLLSRSHEIGAARVQLWNDLPLHFDLFEDAIIRGLCDLWEKSRSWVGGCAREYVTVNLVISFSAVWAREDAVRWKGLKSVRNVWSTRLGVFNRRDLHFILRSEFIRVLKLWILWRHRKYLVSIRCLTFLRNDLYIDLVVEIEFSIPAVLNRDAELCGVASTCGGGNTGTDPDILTGLR